MSWQLNDLCYLSIIKEGIVSILEVPASRVVQGNVQKISHHGLALAPIVNMWEVAGSRGKGRRVELILVFFLMLPSILFMERPFMDFILGEIMSPRASLVENREARMMGSALGRFCGAQRRTKR